MNLIAILLALRRRVDARESGLFAHRGTVPLVRLHCSGDCLKTEPGKGKSASDMAFRAAVFPTSSLEAPFNLASWPCFYLVSKGDGGSVWQSQILQCNYKYGIHSAATHFLSCRHFSGLSRTFQNFSESTNRATTNSTLEKQNPNLRATVTSPYCYRLLHTRFKPTHIVGTRSCNTQTTTAMAQQRLSVIDLVDQCDAYVHSYLTLVYCSIYSPTTLCVHPLALSSLASLDDGLPNLHHQ